MSHYWGEKDRSLQRVLRYTYIRFCCRVEDRTITAYAFAVKSPSKVSPSAASNLVLADRTKYGVQLVTPVMKGDR